MFTKLRLLPLIFDRVNYRCRHVPCTCGGLLADIDGDEAGDVCAVLPASPWEPGLDRMSSSRFAASLPCRLSARAADASAHPCCRMDPPSMPPLSQAVTKSRKLNCVSAECAIQSWEERGEAANNCNTCA